MSGAASLVESAGGLREPVRQALRRHVLTLADTKRLMGIRYSDWVLGSPSLESNIATSSMAQDEWGHARLLYSMLKDLGDDPKRVEHERPATAYTSAAALDHPFEDWAAVVAAMTVVDTALTAALEGFAAGRYEPARRRVGKMVAEEEFHRDLARAWYRRIAGGRPEGRERLAEATRSFLPGMLAWLAPADPPFRALVEEGLCEDGDGVATRYRGRIEGLLEAAGIAAADVEPRRDGWDEERGRGSGHPDEEAVERARGDLNRALFVE